MILYLTDNADIARALRRHLENDGRDEDGQEGNGPKENGLNPPATVAMIPDRLAGAAAHTGRLIAELKPDVTAVATMLVGDPSDRIGVIYRCHGAGETWIPDVPMDHSYDSLSVTAGCAAVNADFHTALNTTLNTAVDTPIISPAAAGALAGAISLLPPARVVGVAAGSAGITGVSAVIDLSLTARNIYIGSDNRRTGGDHVKETLQLSRETAERLRFTATGTARFVAAARSAAIRSGEVPSPVLESRHIPTVTTKTESRARLGELERSLNGWYRAEI